MRQHTLSSRLMLSPLPPLHTNTENMTSIVQKQLYFCHIRQYPIRAHHKDYGLYCISPDSHAETLIPGTSERDCT